MMPSRLRRVLAVGTTAGLCVVVAGVGAAGPAVSATLPAGIYHPFLTIASASPAPTGAHDVESGNWAGYAQGILEGGKRLFRSVSASWVVPTVTQRTPRQPEDSSTWVGIGGGDLDPSNLSVGDVTLIQAGTDQSVSVDGTASYSDWWEIDPPLPSFAVSDAVRPGDRITVSISQSLPEVWTIDLTDRDTPAASFSETIPGLSDYSTADFIEEAPTTVGGGQVGIAAFPNLSTPRLKLRDAVRFTGATVNGVDPGLDGNEAYQLVGASGVLATPSKVTRNDTFEVCSYAASC